MNERWHRRFRVWLFVACPLIAASGVMWKLQWGRSALDLEMYEHHMFMLGTFIVVAMCGAVALLCDACMTIYVDPEPGVTVVRKN